MTDKNQPKNSVRAAAEGEGLEAGSKTRPKRRVRLRLSWKNYLILLAVYALAIGGLTGLCVIHPPQVTWLVAGFDRADTTGTITYEAMFREIGARYGLDWRLLARLAYRESRLNHLAVGTNKEQGLMQIMPSTWAEWAPKVGVSDPFDPYSNVLVAASYLIFLRDYLNGKGYSGDYWMLVAYNWGPENLRQLLDKGGRWNQVPSERRQYAEDILQSVTQNPPGWEDIRDKRVFKTIPSP
jgi:soluble lytic murein transglycosylase-like protein